MYKSPQNFLNALKLNALKTVFKIVLLSLLFSNFAAADSRCKTAEKALRLATEVRGLKAKKSVPCKVQNKEEVKNYLIHSIDKKVPVDRLKGEELVYKHLGIIELDYDYKLGIIDLYTQNLGGYYDPDDEFYVMAGWMPDFVQLPIAVHEQVHALQDQYFKLDDLLDNKSNESDQLLARSALAEGDATCVMYDYSNLANGASLLKDREDISSYILQSLSSTALSSMGSSKLQAIKATLIFPYISGLRFAHRLLREGGYPRIDQAFKELPVSTEQILHPEIYLKGEKGFIDVSPIASKTASTALNGFLKKKILLNDKPFYKDRLGEFFISTFLAQAIGPLAASKAASGWGGDKAAVYYLKDLDSLELASLKLSALKEKNSVLKKPEFGVFTWSTHWDSKKDALEFYEALLEFYRIKEDAKIKETNLAGSFSGANLKTVSFLKINLDDRFVNLISAY